MATLSRPPSALRQTPERSARQKTRSPRHPHLSPHTPSPHGDALSEADRDTTIASSVTTRRSVLATPHALSQHPPPPTSSSRKRSHTAIAADDASADANHPIATATARPPTKVTVTQPHGQLLRITNGVPAALALQQDDIPSGPSTPGATSLPVPAAAPQSQSQDKRSLRSHDGGSRLKSDLATYFANYDDIIAGLPENTSDQYDLETTLHIVDEPLKPSPKRLRTSSPEGSRSLPASPNRSRKKGNTPYQSATSQDVSASLPQPQSSSTAYQVLDYSAIARPLRHNDNDTEDPLPDPLYFTQHRRAERREKQLRNIEKERAMHEKVQLERLLDGLLGPDWLKVMGITGVTDGERKDWEPKRDYFVKEVEALVDKFRIWKEEEKRLRAEKEAALAARDDEDDHAEDSPEADDTSHMNGIEGALKRKADHRKTHNHRPQPDKPDKDDPKPPQQPPRRPPRAPHGYILPPAPPAPLAPFTSFYSKPHLRAAALGKHRHGRNATAFGQPIPDFPEKIFEIPEEFVTPDALRAHARKRRRQKREKAAGGKK